MRVVIPAAGLGTRFVAAGVLSPKELLPLDGKPLIRHALEEAKRASFDSAIVVISPAKKSLAKYLTENELPIPVEIVVQAQPLGIGDAILKCWHSEPIGVLLPDDVVPVSDHWRRLIKVHSQHGSAALCVRPVPTDTTSRFGIAECNGDRVVRLIEKPRRGATSSNLAIFGRYIVTEPVIAGLAKLRVDGELELTYGFSEAISTPEGVRAVRFSGEIYDCGTPVTYASSMAAFSRLVV